MLSRRSVVTFPLAALLSAGDGEATLFDGSTSTGWLSISGDPFPQRSWAIDNGCLKANTPKPGAFQDIRTVEEFDSFDLSFEWKLAPGGNSGVKYSIIRADSFKPKDDHVGTSGLHARARGLEFQLADAGTPDARRGSQYTAGALYGLIAPTAPAPVRAGEFNTARIIYTPTRIEHWINGQLLVEADPSSENFAARARASKDTRLLTRPSRSPIALQNHGSEVWFKNLRLLRLSAAR